MCPYDLGSPGGVQAQVIGLAGALGDLGHEVEIMAPGRTSSPQWQSMGRAIPIRVNGSVAPMAPHPAAARRTWHAVRTGGFDVVHLHEPLAASITLPALVACPAPVVGTFHASGAHTPYRWAGRPLRRLADRIDQRVAVSDAAAELARRHLGGTYDVLFNAVAMPPASPAPVRAGRPRSVCFIGRHEPRKGLEVAIRALDHLPDDVELWIGGGGPETSALRHRTRNDPRVHWLGELTEQEKHHFLSAADVVCVPSLGGESFGVVLLEAMAAGAPVVASNLAGYRAVVGESSAGVLVPPGDPVALAEGLVRVLRDPRLAARLREAGRQLVAPLTFEWLAGRYVELYERVRSSNDSSIVNL